MICAWKSPRFHEHDWRGLLDENREEARSRKRRGQFSLGEDDSPKLFSHGLTEGSKASRKKHRSRNNTQQGQSVRRSRGAQGQTNLLR